MYRGGCLERVGAVGVWDTVFPSYSDGGVDFEVDEEREGSTPEDYEDDNQTAVAVLGSAGLVPLEADEGAIAEDCEFGVSDFLSVQQNGWYLHRIAMIKGPQIIGTWSHLAQ